jgi:hypothetical protein
MSEIPSLKQRVEERAHSFTESSFRTAAVSAISLSIITLFPTTTKKMSLAVDEGFSSSDGQNLKSLTSKLSKWKFSHNQKKKRRNLQPGEMTELWTEHQRMPNCFQIHCIS